MTEGPTSPPADIGREDCCFVGLSPDDGTPGELWDGRGEWLKEAPPGVTAENDGWPFCIDEEGRVATSACEACCGPKDVQGADSFDGAVGGKPARGPTSLFPCVGDIDGRF